MIEKRTPKVLRIQKVNQSHKVTNTIRTVSRVKHEEPQTNKGVGEGKEPKMVEARRRNEEKNSKSLNNKVRAAHVEKDKSTRGKEHKKDNQ